MRVFEGAPLPALESLDFLVVMGGPMGVYDGEAHPWIEDEMLLLREVMERDHCPLLGICLGAQMIARATGVTVHSSDAEEIGWFPVTRSPEAASHPLGEAFPKQFTPFHWHSDMFELPSQAVPLGSSERCPHQGFFLQKRVAGLQFHLELRESDLAALVKDDKLPAEVLQNAEERCAQAKPVLFQLLDQLRTA